MRQTEGKKDEFMESMEVRKEPGDQPTGPEPTELAKADGHEEGNDSAQIPVTSPTFNGEDEKRTKSPFVNKIILGDCLEKLKDIPDNSVDLIVTDPPYGMEFMGKDWDRAVPKVEVWKECLRILKPGAFAFIMCAPRQDCLSKMITNLAEAGFDTNFTSLYWTYANGFPKAYNVAKGIEGKLKLGTANWSEWKNLEGEKGENDLGYAKLQHLQGYRAKNYQGRERTVKVELTTEQAKKFEGAYGGFQPKPAVEVIIVAMKPMDEKTYVAQALKNGKGITWMDDSRIPYSSEREKWSVEVGVTWSPERKWNQDYNRRSSDGGRFPANLLISDDVLDNDKHYRRGSWCRYNGRPIFCDEIRDHEKSAQWQAQDEPPFIYSRFFSLDTWAEKNLPQEIRRNLPFLIVPKASKKEKNAGLDTAQEKTVGDGRKKANDTPFQRGKALRKNTHPTVKPIKLMAYLITLASRDGEIVLDPFAGSGTTCIAAKILNRRFIGIELDEKYHEIAVRRIRNAENMKGQLTLKPALAVADNSNAESGTKGSQGPHRKDNSPFIDKVFLGDCFEAIRHIEDSSVDLCLTSPPYADMKSYGEGVKTVQPDEYADWLLPLLREIHRVLKPTGSLILNINDRIVNRRRHTYVHELIVRAVRETPLRLYDTYTWVKKGTLPTGNTKRLNDWTEYLIHLCKDENLIKWNMDAVREPHSPKTISRCKSPVGGFELRVDQEGRASGRPKKLVQLNEKGKIPCNVFSFPTSAAVKNKIHPAAFHIALPTWFINALTDQGDLVLDPFCGTGTTCLAAQVLERRFIGIEISPLYHEDAVKGVENVILKKAA